MLNCVHIKIIELEIVIYEEENKRKLLFTWYYITQKNIISQVYYYNS